MKRTGIRNRFMQVPLIFQELQKPLVVLISKSTAIFMIIAVVYE